jgi:aspartyl-tRNA(Asn)/glutamyl-tRNA(Gln) amidotransferase subunit A
MTHLDVHPDLHPDHHHRDLLQSARAATQPAGLRKTLDALATRQISATALAEQALHAAEASQRSINAFSTIDWDRALKAAAESDRRYADNRQRPLEGLPIAIKDLIDTKGLPRAPARRRCRHRESADGARRDPHRQDHDA